MAPRIKGKTGANKVAIIEGVWLRYLTHALAKTSQSG